MVTWQNSGKKVSTGDQKQDRKLQIALARSQRLIRQVHGERDRARLETADLQREVAAQAKQLQQLREGMESVARREQELRAMLLGAHDQLMRRVEEIKVDLAIELQRPSPEQGDRGLSPAVPPVEANPEARLDYERLSKYFAYRRMVDRLREAANAALPSEATVAVISKGDEELLELGGGRTGWHFPQGEAGAYVGYHPASGAEAISHLEELRGKGAGFLLIPGTALWWLEYYEEFRDHLDSRYHRVRDDENYVIYKLFESDSSSDAS